MATNHSYKGVVLAGLVLVAMMLAVQMSAGVNDGDPRPLAVVVHKSTPIDNISLAELRRMLTGDTRAWAGWRTVALIEQPDESRTQQRMTQLVLKASPAGYRQQLLRHQFQGQEPPLIKVLNSDESAIRFVFNLPGALAVVDAAEGQAYPSVKILKVDGKNPGERGYPLQ